MTVATFDTALPTAARPPRRDIGIKKRYAAEARFNRLEGLHGLLADGGDAADRLR